MKKAKKSIILLIFLLIFSFIFPQSAFAVYSNGSTNSNYNRTNAANYVYNYTTSPNSNWSKYTQDCTNFVSQVLYAGGMPMTGSTANPSTSSWSYYYDQWGYGRSSSWASAHAFRSYWADVNGAGAKKANEWRKLTAKDVKSTNGFTNNLYFWLEPGDIIQYCDSTGETYHSQAVHRLSYENSEFKVSIGQYISDQWRNLRLHIRT